MTNIGGFSALALACCLGAGCSDSSLSDAERQAVQAWLVCDECAEGELARVTRLGNRAVALLDTALRQALPQDREHLRRNLIETHTRLSPLDASQGDYVTRQLGNVDALFQIRAATALRDIDTPDAHDALQRAVDSAAARHYRPDVVAAIEDALSTARFAPFAGVLAPESAGFLDTVLIRPGARPAWDGDERVHVSGSPFPDSLVIMQNTDSLKFVAVAEIGPHATLITGLGTQADTQVVPLVITRNRYRPAPPTAAPLVNGSTLPSARAIYFALGAHVGDTTDHFRFQLGGPLLVTARLEWSGMSALSLSWHICPVPHSLHVLPGTGVHGRVVDEKGVAQGGAQVRIEATVLSTTTDSLGDFAFDPVVLPSPITLSIRKIGFRPLRYGVQRGGPRHSVTLLAATSTDATARNIRTSSVLIPGGSCWLLRVTGRSGSGTQIAKLRLTSP